MKFYLFISFVIVLSFLIINSNGNENENKKVKCKEHIDAALKQYWDHENDPSQDRQHKLEKDNLGEDDDDENSSKIIKTKINKIENIYENNIDDDDDSYEKKITDKEVIEEDNEIKDKIDYDDDDDKDDDDDDDDNDSDDDDTKEIEDLKKKINNKKNFKIDNNNDDDDDDDDDNDDDIDEKKLIKKDDDDDNDDDADKKNNKIEEKIKQVKLESLNKKNDKIKEEKIKIQEAKIKKNEKISSINPNISKDKDEKNKKIKKNRETKISKKIKYENENENDEVRSRLKIEQILHLDEIGSVSDKEEQSLIQNIFKDLKRIHENSIKPLELLYKYRSITNRLISDTEIFAKPMVLFIGGKASGKTSLINYLLGIENTKWKFPTGHHVSQPYFTVINYGPDHSKLTSIEFAADLQFSSLQQFGENFINERIQAYKLPIDILERMTIVDSASILENVKKEKSSDTEIFQWFFDRSDVIYMTLDVKQLSISNQMQTILEQLKGRDIRFILTKTDTVKHGELILLIGQLFWILSPLIAADKPPQVYALTTSPLSQHDVFLEDQEQLWLSNLSKQVLGVARIESRIASVRRHAIRVRNHAKLVDCFLATYYKHKSLFMFGESAKKLANEITQNPEEYNIFSKGISTYTNNYYNQLSEINSNINIENKFNMNNVNKVIANEAIQNISRFDLPDADVYKAFFSVNTLLDFKPLSSTCSFFRGCPIDKLDLAIAYQLPDLVSKYKKLTKFTLN